MADKLEIILDRCLDEIKKGKSIEYCLSLYPDFASELEPLLRLATDIEKLPKPEPRKEAINSTLIKIGEAITSQREKKVGKKVFHWPFMLTPAVARALAIVVIFIIAIGSMATISTRSLPGSWLYPIKLTTEKVQFAFIRNPEGKAEFWNMFGKISSAEWKAFEITSNEANDIPGSACANRNSCGGLSDRSS